METIRGNKKSGWGGSEAIPSHFGFTAAVRGD
jgi:hypothetical protein